MKSRITAGRHSALTLRGRIRQAREILGMSRAELARKVGVSASAAVQWERPHGTSPSAANLIAIAHATDVSFEWLATGRGMARVRADGEVSAIHRDCMAHDLYEESILVLARNVPRPQREPPAEFPARYLFLQEILTPAAILQVLARFLALIPRPSFC